MDCGNESREDWRSKRLSQRMRRRKFVTGSGENGVGGVALGEPEIISAHLAVTPRFWPEMKTQNL